MSGQRRRNICKKVLYRGSKDPHKMTTSSLKNHIKSKHRAVHSELLHSENAEETTEDKHRKQGTVDKFLSVATGTTVTVADEQDSDSTSMECKQTPLPNTSSSTVIKINQPT